MEARGFGQVFAAGALLAITTTVTMRPDAYDANGSPPAPLVAIGLAVSLMLSAHEDRVDDGRITQSW